MEGTVFQTVEPPRHDMAEITQNNLTGLEEVLTSTIWGDLDQFQVPWIKLTVRVQKFSLMKPDMTISITAEVEPDFLHPAADKGKISARKTVSFETVVVADFQDLFLRHVLDLMSNIAPRMYEVDPRIGMTLVLPNDMPTFVLSKSKFPRCLIFDPPRDNLSKEAELFVAKRWTPICALCGNNRRFERLEDCDFYWGGGNIKWVHGVCAPWIEPITGQPFRRDYGTD